MFNMVEQTKWYLKGHRGKINPFIQSYLPNSKMSQSIFAVN